MQVALVHDDLVQAGGAERVAEALHTLYPQAPLYTSVYDPKTTLPAFAAADVRTSFLQRWPVSHSRWHKLALAQYPAAFEQFDLSDYDLVISSCSRFAKGVITRPETCHICYCHTPPRFAWRSQDYFTQSPGVALLAPLMRPMLRALRSWDVDSAQRVDYFVANSRNVARRIRKHYRRESVVIYPPVDTSRFSPVASHEVGTHFLVVSRLLTYKRIDLAIEACNRLKVPLRIIGSGPDKTRLQRLAGPTIQFLGQLSDRQVAAEYARCAALIFPGEEDFGMTPIESMASGRPVVAYAAGGALETVIDGETGILFHAATPDTLAIALTAVDTLSIIPEALQQHAQKFDICTFQDRIRRFVAAATATHAEAYGSRLAMVQPVALGKPLTELPVTEMLPGFGFSK